MHWLIFSLIAPALWALSNHIDKILITKYFQNNSISTLILYSGFIGLPSALLIFLFTQDVLFIGFINTLVSILIGAIYMCALISYFCALEKGEASQVAPLFQLSPIFSVVLGYYIFDEYLSLDQLVGSFVILFGSIGLVIKFNKLDKSIIFNKSIFLLMVFASFLLSLEGILFKFVAIKDTFWATTFWMYIGFFIYTFALFSFSKRIRTGFFISISENKKKIIGLNLLNEIITLLGNLLFNFAIILAPIGLVYFVSEGTQPFFVFLYGVILTKFFPKISKENIQADHLIQKVLAIILMAVGVYLVSS